MVSAMAHKGQTDPTKQGELRGFWVHPSGQSGKLCNFGSQISITCTNIDVQLQTGSLKERRNRKGLYIVFMLSGIQILRHNTGILSVKRN